MDDVIPEKTKRGFDPKKAEFVEYLRLQGVSVKDACEKAKMSYSTYHGWKTRHPDRLNEIRREVAKASDIQWIILRARRRALLTLDDEEASPHTRLDAAKFLIRSGDPQLGEKVNQSDSNRETIELDLDSMSTEELESELQKIEEKGD